MRERRNATRVNGHHIAPRKPTHNAFIESSNGRLGNELSNEEVFTSVAGARRQPARRRFHDNTVRPHSALGSQSLVIAHGATERGALAQLEQ